MRTTIALGGLMFGILSAHGLYSLARAFIGAVLIIYLLNHGINLSVIALAKAAQLVMSVLFNYPAGKISDKYGNKATILMACLSEIIYFSLMVYPSDHRVILGEIFNGLGIALYAGAFEAWLFTHKEGKEDSFSLISRSSEILFIATIISGVIGALFLHYSLLLSICFMAVSCVVYFFTDEKQKFINDKVHRKEETLGFIKFFKKNDFNIVNYIILGGFMQLIYQFWPVFFKNQPMAYLPQEIGYVFAASMISLWIFTTCSRKIKFNKKTYASLFCYIGIIITSILTIISPYYLTMNYSIIVLFYCLFISFANLTVNYFFSQSCNIFSNARDETSQISLLDASARCFGALCLGIVSLFDIQNISAIWAVFPIFTLCILLFTLSKKVLIYEYKK